ncbi:uncharacterized protein LOC120342923 [Styela clava]
MTFFPGEDVYYEHSGCKITGIKCKYDGTVSISEDYDCDITSTTPSTTTSTQKTSPTTPPTQRPGCHHDGIFYNPGELILEYQQKEVCVKTTCELNGVKKDERIGDC